MVHGYLKLERGVDVFVAALNGIGVPFPHLMAWITVLVELVGGVAVLLGAFVPLVSGPMLIVLLVAIVKVHAQFGFSSIKFLSATSAGLQFGKPGVECDLLYVACLLTLVMGGVGPFAIDGWRAKRRQSAVIADESTG